MGNTPTCSAPAPASLPRSPSAGQGGLRRPRGIRTVSGPEQEETFNLSGVLVLVGLLLLVLEAAVDPRTQLI